MFVDRAKIYVRAGDGGAGCESFYYKKGMRHRRRDGGDGGKGGNIVARADGNVHTLLDFRYRRHFKAESGKHGGSNKKRGRDAHDTIIQVPAGTIIRDADTGCLIRDLDRVNEHVVVVYGGTGGKGNYKRDIATAGESGQKKTISLELKLIADAGLIGYPNAGKSSFINIVSAAKSKVAHFPFTTIRPVLGAITASSVHGRFVIADIPGLIKGAHRGKGLGTEFLRHIERTRLLLFVIDMAGTDGRSPYQDYRDLVKEIELYDRRLLKRPRLLLANKMDIPEAATHLGEWKRKTRQKIYPLSCKSQYGIDSIVKVLLKKLSA